MKVLSLVFLFTLNAWSAEMHDIHISKCIIHYSETDQALQIMIHAFADDLEFVIQEKDAEPLKLNTQHEHSSSDEVIINYLQNTFSVDVNGNTREYDYIGKEPSEDLQAVWIYLEIPEVSNIEEMKIDNSILTELYDDHVNIIQIKGEAGKQAYFLLDKDKTSEVAKF